MRKKTIGEVLRLARINQGLSLEELQRKTDIQLNLLEALESDDFDQLPSPFYTRSFLRKYAWAVELDENLVLDAYDSGSMITYEEVDVDEIELSGRRRSNRKKRSLLPLFYFILFSLSIIIFSTSSVILPSCKIKISSPVFAIKSYISFKYISSMFLVRQKTFSE